MGLKAPTLDEATAYLQICALGILPIFGYNALSAMLRSVGNSRQPFYCVAVTAVCNIVLDCLFMGTFQWGVRGAALATMLAQLASFVVCLVYVLKHKDLFGLARKALRMHRDKLGQMLKLGIPCAVQMTVVGLSWLAMTFLINQYGVEASAASGICAKIKDVGAYFAVSDAPGEIGAWDSRLQVTSRGYMLGYNDLRDPSVSGFFRFLARVGDHGMKMQIVKIRFGDRK